MQLPNLKNEAVQEEIFLFMLQILRHIYAVPTYYASEEQPKQQRRCKFSVQKFFLHKYVQK